MIKVYLCINDFGVIKNMMEHDNESGKIKIVGISTTVMENRNELDSLDVDILVLQYSMDPEKAKQLMEYIMVEKKLDLKILPLFQELDAEVIHILLQYDLQNFLVQPFTLAQLQSAIESEHLHKQSIAAAVSTIESIASEIMLSLGLPPHLDGFHYMQSCAIYVARNMEETKVHMKIVYQEVAKIHHSTSLRVEKCIRTAINFAYRNQPEKICIHNCKPTNTQIILYISEKLKLFEK